MQITVEASSFRFNSAEANGGGLDIDISATPEQNYFDPPMLVRLVNNRIIASRAAGDGGGLYLTGLVKVGRLLHGES